MQKVVVVGSANYDIFLRLSAVPRIGETAEASYVFWAAGGKGANQAVQIAKLGIPVYFAGCVGDDFMGRFLLDSMQEAGVDVSGVYVSEDEKTGMGIVESYSDGSVRAIICHGANEEVEYQKIEKVIKSDEDISTVVLQLEIPSHIVEKTVLFAKECGKSVFLNAAPARHLSEQCIKACDCIIVNEIEAEFYLGEAVKNIQDAQRQMKSLAEKYDNCWICTMGEKGAVVAAKEKFFHVPAERVKVVETTGAGDSFVGGLIWGILSGKEIYESARCAAKCSALTIGEIGAQRAMPTRYELLKHYENI